MAANCVGRQRDKFHLPLFAACGGCLAQYSSVSREYSSKNIRYQYLYFDKCIEWYFVPLFLLSFSAVWCEDEGVHELLKNVRRSRAIQANFLGVAFPRRQRNTTHISSKVRGNFLARSRSVAARVNRTNRNKRLLSFVFILIHSKTPKSSNTFNNHATLWRTRLGNTRRYVCSDNTRNRSSASHWNDQYSIESKCLRVSTISIAQRLNAEFP